MSLDAGQLFEVLRLCRLLCRMLHCIKLFRLFSILVLTPFLILLKSPQRIHHVPTVTTGLPAKEQNRH